MLAELGGLVPMCGPIGWIAAQAGEGAPVGSSAYTCIAAAANKHTRAMTFTGITMPLHYDHGLNNRANNGLSCL